MLAKALNGRFVGMERADPDLTQLICKISGGSVVSPQTKLFHDLGLAGDDAAELLEAVRTCYGTRLEGFQFADYFPDETEALVVHWTRWMGSSRLKRPLTVDHLTKVIDRGAWFDP